MADGYIVEVTTPQEAEGKPLRQTWYAHIPDKNRAIRAVRKAAEAPKGAAVDVVRPEKHKVLLERLALLEGEVRRG
jgi:hypothetical protein